MVDVTEKSKGISKSGYAFKSKELTDYKIADYYFAVLENKKLFLQISSYFQYSHFVKIAYKNVCNEKTAVYIADNKRDMLLSYSNVTAIAYFIISYFFGFKCIS